MPWMDLLASLETKKERKNLFTSLFCPFLGSMKIRGICLFVFILDPSLLLKGIICRKSYEILGLFIFTENNRSTVVSN